VHLLDTNTCFYAIRRRPPDVLARLNALDADSVALSVVVALAEFKVLPLEDTSRVHFARINCELMERGQMIGPMDLLIASHALALRATLVTNNTREFRRVKGLKLENWVDG
jgi:tRNA(fMet)-specific endonuclease VapC